MPRMKGTAIPGTRNDFHRLTTAGARSPEFEFDAKTVTGEIVSFEHRLGTADPKTYKYPNIELQRNF